MRIAEAELVRYRLPLVAPLPLSTGTLHAREGVLVRVASADGHEAWGEASPLPGFSPDTLVEAIRQLTDFVEVLRDGSADPERAAHALPSPAARFAAEAALASLRAEQAEQSLAEQLWASPQSMVPLNALLVGSHNEVVERAERVQAAGYTAAKLKVGRRTVEDDAATVHAVANALGPNVALRLDANRAWALDEAAAFAEALADVPIAYIEEPLAEPMRLPELVARTGLPIALDESLLVLAPKALADHDYATAVILKPSFLGWARTVAWIEAAGRYAIESVISAAFETGVGMRALIALAAGTAAPAGLDTYRWLAADVITPRLELGRPRVDVAEVLASGRVQPISAA